MLYIKIEHDVIENRKEDRIFFGLQLTIGCFLFYQKQHFLIRKKRLFIANFITVIQMLFSRLA